MYTITEAKGHTKNVVREYFYKDAEGRYVMNERNRQPIYLEGPPGIGKTEIVGQVCEELGIGYVSASLVHMTRNSLLGLPVINIRHVPLTNTFNAMVKRVVDIGGSLFAIVLFSPILL